MPQAMTQALIHLSTIHKQAYKGSAVTELTDFLNWKALSYLFINNQTYLIKLSTIN